MTALLHSVFLANTLQDVSARYQKVRNFAPADPKQKWYRNLSRFFQGQVCTALGTQGMPFLRSCDVYIGCKFAALLFWAW